MRIFVAEFVKQQEKMLAPCNMVVTTESNEDEIIFEMFFSGFLHDLCRSFS